MTALLPWPGPRPYTDRLSPVFRGRESELTQLLNLLQGQRLTLMTASSGAGKTSLLQAGLIPRIREFRLTERGGEMTRQPVAPFPLLVNQWLERAGKGETMSFSHLLALEMHRYLRESVEWYSRRTSDPGVLAEVAAIEAAADALAALAEAEGFARRADAASRGALVWIQRDRKSSAREMTDCLLAIVDAVHDNLGDMLLILDQFEEILLDCRMGEEAQEAVESIYRLRHNEVRQLVSMRDDGLHLFDELQTKGLLEAKRRLKIQPLTKEAIEGIVRDVSAAAGHAWDDTSMPDGSTLLAKLIASFTQKKTGGGTRAGEVNLVGLQVVLNAVFQEWLAEGETVTAEVLANYCSSLAGGGSAERSLSEWLDGGYLTHHAPLSWVARCLNPETGAGSVDTSNSVFELQINPLAARMSWLLVTPAGNKRTMTASELHEYAYGEAAQKLELSDLSGSAAEAGWTLDDYKRVMKATCNEALDRLTHGNVLKKRGSETGADIAYELVHDQFGKPFQAWADDFVTTPEYDLNSLHALKSTEFKWTGALRPHDDDGVIPFAKWEDCTLHNVDLSDLTFVHCDFGESIFQACTFNNVCFQDCDLTNVSFKACSFDTVTFTRSELRSSRWSDGTSLRSVNSGMSYKPLPPIIPMVIFSISLIPPFVSSIMSRFHCLFSI